MKSPFIIAEISGNHNGDINRALKLIEQAKQSGATAVKLQTYTADTMTIPCVSEDFQVKGGLWDNYTLYELYQKAHTPWEWHEALFAKGKELGIMVFSTPFDETAVDFLESLNTPIYKIASFEIVDINLIARVAKTKKPMIISTGLSNISDIDLAAKTAISNGCTDLTLLHCVSSYPAAINDCNLATMVDLKSRYPNCKIGLSDHTLGTIVATAAVALGAEVVEKHFTLSRKDGGVDSAFSLEPEELKDLCIKLKDVVNSIGEVNYNRTDNEQKNKIFRRSLYIVKPISRGEKFTEKNVRSIRPGFGISPHFLEKILGKKAKKDCGIGERLTFDLVEDEV